MLWAVVGRLGVSVNKPLCTEAAGFLMNHGILRYPLLYGPIPKQGPDRP